MNTKSFCNNDPLILTEEKNKMQNIDFKIVLLI